jgi:2-dehydropantoate 2-reductase
MAEVRKIAILGAGAMGASIASWFYNADGFSTSIIAGGERYERLKKDGLAVNDKPYVIPVIHPDETGAPSDLIIVALKHHQLPEAVNDLRNAVGDNTTIISVMNGLDSEELLAEVYGWDKVLYAIAVGMDAFREGNRIVNVNPGKIYFGEADNTTKCERVRRVQNAFEKADVAHETPPDMIRMLWWKFMINVGMNQASAVMRAPYSVFHSSPDARALMTALMREVIALAQGEGVDLSEQDLERWQPVMYSLFPQGKTSMLQDIEAGRKTEVEMFAGKVLELSKKQGVPTPANQTIYHLIKVLEQY